jgi:hypothetical protein
VASPSACVPGTATSTTSAPIDCGRCGVTYTETTTCTCRPDGCGVSCGTTRSRACPPCSPDDQRPVSCTDGQGCGGWASESCTSSCQWGGPVSECVNSRTCAPSTEVLGCPNGCDAYTRIRTCNACGDASTTSDYAQQCNSLCSLNQTHMVPCGNCGQYRVDTCSPTCDYWTEGVCPPNTCG